MKKEKLTQENVNSLFLNACKTGDYYNFTKLYNDYYLKHNKSIFSSFLKIFNKEPVLELSELNSKYLLATAMHGHFNLVKHLLDNKEYVKKINKNDLLLTYLIGSLNPVRLKVAAIPYEDMKNIWDLMYESIKEKNIFHAAINKVFLKSCEEGDFDGVKYITQHTKLKEHLTFDLEYKPIKINDILLLNYLINELNMEKNEKFMNTVKLTDNMKKVIEKKNLYNDLSINLALNGSSSNYNKRIKI